MNKKKKSTNISPYPDKASKEKQSVTDGERPVVHIAIVCGFFRVRLGGAPCFCFTLFSLVPQFFFRCPQAVSAGHYFRYPERKPRPVDAHGADIAANYSIAASYSYYKKRKK